MPSRPTSRHYLQVIQITLAPTIKPVMATDRTIRAVHGLLGHFIEMLFPCPIRFLCETLQVWCSLYGYSVVLITLLYFQINKFYWTRSASVRFYRPVQSRSRSYLSTDALTRRLEFLLQFCLFPFISPRVLCSSRVYAAFNVVAWDWLDTLCPIAGGEDVTALDIW